MSGLAVVRWFETGGPREESLLPSSTGNQRTGRLHPGAHRVRKYTMRESSSLVSGGAEVGFVGLFSSSDGRRHTLRRWCCSWLGWCRHQRPTTPIIRNFQSTSVGSSFVVQHMRSCGDGYPAPGALCEHVPFHQSHDNDDSARKHAEYSRVRGIDDLPADRLWVISCRA